MSLSMSWYCTCVLAMVVCAMLKPSLSQDCSTEEMENTTIDIKAAISKGIQGTDPIHTTSQEACVTVCCLERKIAGNNPCNYVVFNARRKGSSPNCYLFYYPMKETCPMKQGVGLVTYQMIRTISFQWQQCYLDDLMNQGCYVLFSCKPGTSTRVGKMVCKNTGHRHAEVPGPTFSSVKVSHSVVKGGFLTPKTSSFDLSSLSPPRDSLEKTTAFKQKESLSHAEKYLDKIEEHPNGERANGPEDFGPWPVSEISSLLPPTIANTIQLAVPTGGLTVKQPVVTTGTHTAAAAAATQPHGSPSSVKVARPTTVYNGNSYQPTVKPSTTTVLQSSVASVFTASSPIPLPSSTTIESPPVSLSDVHHSSGQSLEGYSLDGTPTGRAGLHFGDKSILLTALLFGVILLLLVTVLVGRKMLESLQKRRYTRLDYLINGMYANM